MDRELLARALEAEAGNQGIEGMLAAGSVIMNRTRTPGYGGDLQGVILKPGQFSAFNSVTGYAGGEQGQDIDNIRVSDNAYQVADALLSGDYKDPTGGATHFYNPRISNPSWGEDNGGNWMKIGDHVFGRADAGKSGQPIEVTKLPSNPEAKRAAAIQFEGVDPALRQRNAAIQGEAVNSFVPNANANNVGPRPNMQAQTGLLAGDSPQNMMGAGQAMQAEEPSKGFFDNDKYKNMAAVLAQGFAAMGNNPALQKFASQVAGQRTEAQAKNKTIEFLRKSGRDDLADAVESGSLGARDAAKVLFAQPKAKGQTVSAEALRKIYPNTQIEDGIYNIKPDGTVSKVGGGGPSVVVEGAKAQETFEKLDSEYLIDVGKMGSEARKLLFQVNELGRLLEGEGGPMTSLKALAGRFGIKTENVSNIEAAQALMSRLIPQQRQEGSGPMSDRDLTMYARAFPQLIGTPEGNQLIIDSLRAIALYDIEGEKIVQRRRSGKITTAQAYQELQDRSDPFAELRKEGYMRLSEDEAPAANNGQTQKVVSQPTEIEYDRFGKRKTGD